jgi:hypothetical protein
VNLQAVLNRLIGLTIIAAGAGGAVNPSHAKAAKHAGLARADEVIE